MFKDQFYTSFDEFVYAIIYFSIGFYAIVQFLLDFGHFNFRNLKNFRYWFYNLCCKYFSVNFLLCLDYAKAFFKNDFVSDYQSSHCSIWILVIKKLLPSQVT